MENITTLAGSSGVGAVVGTVGTAITSTLGFTSSGIAAGSAAAGIQAGIGNVAAGSAFAVVQSLAAVGLLPVILIGGGAAIGLGIGAAILLRWVMFILGGMVFKFFFTFVKNFYHEKWLFLVFKAKKISLGIVIYDFKVYYIHCYLLGSFLVINKL